MSDLVAALTTLSLLEQERKRTKKDVLLQQQAENKILQRIFVYTYEWSITYGITVAEPLEKDPAAYPEPAKIARLVHEQHWHDFRQLLRRLWKRELTGGAAEKALADCFASCTPFELRWFRRILNRDLNVGVADSMVLDVWPKLLTEFGVQNAKDRKQLKSDDLDLTKLAKKTKAYRGKPYLKPPFWIEPKYNGVRVMIFVRDGLGVVRSKTGHEAPNLKFFADQFVTFQQKTGCPDFVIDGEFRSPLGRRTTMSLFTTHPDNMTDEKVEQLAQTSLYTFDHLTANEYDSGGSALPLRLRKRRLKQVVVPMQADGCSQIKVAPHEIAEDLDEAMRLYALLRKKGLEGAMLKYPDAPYEFGRNVNWIKLKPFKSIDVRIVGMVRGKAGTKLAHSLGALIVEDEKGVQFRVGGGISEKMRKWFIENEAQTIGKMCEISLQDEDESDKSAKACHAYFICMRPDKD